MVALPLAYRICIYFWPPDEKPRQSLTQFFEEAKVERCIKLLTKPIAKWTDAEVKSEPEIYAWLGEQGNEILPWEWTEEARRKDLKGYAKRWLRIWKDRKAHCENLLAKHQKDVRRIDRELQTLTVVHAHRTNQIARLIAMASTNAFPCKVAVERLEKGRLWGWNKKAEVVECKNAAAVIAPTNSICSRETAISLDEIRDTIALANSVSSAREKSLACEKLREICGQNIRLIETNSLEDEVLKKSLVENIKGAKQ